MWGFHGEPVAMCLTMRPHLLQILHVSGRGIPHPGTPHIYTSKTLHGLMRSVLVDTSPYFKIHGIEDKTALTIICLLSPPRESGTGHPGLCLLHSFHGQSLYQFSPPALLPLRVAS